MEKRGKQWENDSVTSSLWQDAGTLVCKYYRCQSQKHQSKLDSLLQSTPYLCTSFSLWSIFCFYSASGSFSGCWQHWAGSVQLGCRTGSQPCSHQHCPSTSNCCDLFLHASDVSLSLSQIKMKTKIYQEPDLHWKLQRTIYLYRNLEQHGFHQIFLNTSSTSASTPPWSSWADRQVSSKQILSKPVSTKFTHIIVNQCANAQKKGALQSRRFSDSQGRWNTAPH